MKQVLVSLIVLFLYFYPPIFPQTNFNLQQYKEFLAGHQNMEPQDLMQMFDAGVFRSTLNINIPDAYYFDSINTNYNLTNYEKSLIQDHGFMVSERLNKETFGEAFLEIYHKDLPVFVSTDAILHAFHSSYDRILKDVELGYLIPKLTELLNTFSAAFPQLHNQYSSSSEMLTMLKDADIYITIPRRLLGLNVQPYYSENVQEINNILALIEEEQLAPYPFFSTHCKDIDFSQFKPRGHYIDEEHPILANYFKAMMWFGRIEVYLLKPSTVGVLCFEPQSDEDIQRQTIDALLIAELIESANSQPDINGIEDIIKYFVGNSDNVTYPDLVHLRQITQVNNASQLLDTIKLKEFHDSLKNQPYANQLILSQVLLGHDPFSPDSIVPASAFMLFGQRFVIDSYVMASVVYDRIFYNGQKVCRLFPSTLDPMFALGNDAAAQLLINELNTWHYSSNMAALRYIIDQYSNEFWESTIYNFWLNGIRKLNPPLSRNSLPLFMQTAAFWQEKLNTQLFSWTQLRHDNLLYAKQSYTGGTICSYPYSYVEPFPEFFTNFKLLAQSAYTKFQSLNFLDPLLQTNVLEYFDNLYNISDTLSIIASKELSSIPLTGDEAYWLKKMIYTNTPGSGTPPYGGWYARLFYNDPAGEDGLLKKNYIVADVHTIPTDCGGVITGWVDHVGTGPINLGVVITDIPNTGAVAFIGPFLSYFDYRTTDFLRLTDDEWDQTYLNASLRPDWVNIYLADSSGNSKGAGASLITSVDNKGPELVETYLTAKNYPNPFNSSTVIVFNIPFNLTGEWVELSVYNIQGEKVKTLINNELASGNYLTKWDGTNDAGISVSSGIYIYRLQAAQQQYSAKMTLLK